MTAERRSGHTAQASKGLSARRPGNGKMSAPVVRGSAYVTAEFEARPGRAGSSWPMCVQSAHAHAHSPYRLQCGVVFRTAGHVVQAATPVVSSPQQLVPGPDGITHQVLVDGTAANCSTNTPLPAGSVSSRELTTACL